MCKCHLLLELERARITSRVHQYTTKKGLIFNGVPNAHNEASNNKTEQAQT
jgi:hypothetical protein